MDYTAEHEFVRSFVRKNRRDRLLHELTTPQKRYAGLSRFCHHAEQLLDPAKTVMNGEDMDRRPEFRQFVREHAGDCFVMSPDPWMDGRTLPLKEAVDGAVICPDAVVIAGKGFAVVFGEPMKGGRGKYLLSGK